MRWGTWKSATLNTVIYLHKEIHCGAQEHAPKALTCWRSSFIAIAALSMRFLCANAAEWWPEGSSPATCACGLTTWDKPHSGQGPDTMRPAPGRQAYNQHARHQSGNVRFNEPSKEQLIIHGTRASFVLLHSLGYQLISFLPNSKPRSRTTTLRTDLLLPKSDETDLLASHGTLIPWASTNWIYSGAGYPSSALV